MTTAASPPPKPSARKGREFDPDSFRMTIGEHLEDLRRRMIFGLIGFAVAIFVCVAFTQRVVVFFTAPLVNQMLRHHLDPSLCYTQITEPFMTYLKIWVISAAALAGPWMVYQIWQFVAAGLYPNERHMVTKYIPLSVTLLIAGFVFVYVVVLPLTMAFFLEFSSAMPLPTAIPHGTPIAAGTYAPFHLPVIQGDPARPAEGEIWINAPEGRIKAVIGGQPRVMLFGAGNLLTPMITLADYIDLVLTFMITFGLAFQLPLVVLALVSLGLVEIDFLRKQRRMIYFVMAIASAFLAPGDIVTSMLALLVPLVVLYEFGLFLAAMSLKKASASTD